MEEEGNPTERKHRLSRRLLTREQHNASTAARPRNGVQRKSCARAQFHCVMVCGFSKAAGVLATLHNGLVDGLTLLGFSLLCLLQNKSDTLSSVLKFCQPY